MANLAQVLAGLIRSDPQLASAVFDELQQGGGADTYLAGSEADDQGMERSLEGDVVQEGRFDPPDDIVRQMMPTLDYQHQGAGSRVSRPPPAPAGIAPDDWAPARPAAPPATPMPPADLLRRNFQRYTDYSTDPGSDWLPDDPRATMRNPYVPHVNAPDEMGPVTPFRAPYRP